MQIHFPVFTQVPGAGGCQGRVRHFPTPDGKGAQRASPSAEEVLGTGGDMKKRGNAGENPVLGEGRGWDEHLELVEDSGEGTEVWVSAEQPRHI